jgi:hypothetical protein
MFDYSLMFIQDHLVFDMLKKLPPKCNTTPDNIPAIVLKRCASSLTSPIAKIFRRSFFLGNATDFKKLAITLYHHRVQPAHVAQLYRVIVLIEGLLGCFVFLV